jgi:UDP-3-O-[3-hydroxymyristoyl] glucosamine N-acyltransferase
MVDTNFFIKKGGFNIAKIAKVCGAAIKDLSKSQVPISDINTMDNAGEGQVCFFYDRKKKEAATDIKATACVTTEELAQYVPENVIILISDDPKMAFLKLNEAMYSEKKPEPHIAETAKIHPTAKIGQGCSIADYVIIGENVVIGDNTTVEPFVFIKDSCRIGNNCHLGAGCYIAYTIMGNNCFIFNGARIGQDGFGFQTTQGIHKRIPQLGRVIMGNDVEVGSCTCIDRGALDDTIIGDGCRFDNLVQVAHNDKLGKGCVVVSMTGIAGSCTFGDYVVCGGQTGFADHLTIGSGAQIAAQAGVIRDIEPGAVVMGTPAVPFKDFMRQAAFLQKNSKK